MSLIEDLPQGWKEYRVSESPSPTWTYRHQYLDVEVSVLGMDADEMNPEADTDLFYSISLQWAADGFGGVEDFFDPVDQITSEANARDWTLALMTQIDNQFVPGDTNYVGRAMRAAEGQQTTSGSSSNFADEPTCPACDAPFFQFRGMDTYEQAQNHFEYMDDEEHEGWDVSIEQA
ncbi:hypothetical protein JMJ58_05350 [Haloterrigena salifodinae]|uniref:Uncharacterized protein n=1 Tax=Haloterrigena salifodinae TaxID=2675099 RepID=A0A8T8E3M1_9EURY|nr:hypothetical protein [Haloterrigena salifodinae]QRV16319.1 hypothetical protein JMJ58_05350 [Haloterrigena salifodinae]